MRQQLLSFMMTAGPIALEMHGRVISALQGLDLPPSIGAKNFYSEGEARMVAERERERVQVLSSATGPILREIQQVLDPYIGECALFTASSHAIPSTWKPEVVGEIRDLAAGKIEKRTALASDEGLHCVVMSLFKNDSLMGGVIYLANEKSRNLLEEMQSHLTFDLSLLEYLAKAFSDSYEEAYKRYEFLGDAYL